MSFFSYIATYFGLSTDLIITFFNRKSASSRILNEFFSSPLANAILPSNSDAFEIYVCYK